MIRKIRRIHDNEVTYTNKQRTSSIDTPILTSPVENVKGLEKKLNIDFSTGGEFTAIDGSINEPKPKPFYVIRKAEEMIGCIKDDAVVCVDAEWDWLSKLWGMTPYGPLHTQSAVFLTSQFKIRNPNEPVRKVVVWSKDIPLPPNIIPEYINAAEWLTLDIVLEDPNNYTPVTHGWIQANAKIDGLIYAAATDNEALFGRKIWLDALKKNKPSEYGNSTYVSKGRKINCTVMLPDNIKIVVRDVFGMANNGDSLAKFLVSVGMTDKYKNLAEGHDKGKMGDWMRGEPTSFLVYSSYDTDLDTAVEKRTEILNRLIQDAIGVNPAFVPMWERLGRKIPGTSGALVSDVFNFWLHSEYASVLTELLEHTNFINRKDFLKFSKEVLFPLRGETATTNKHVDGVWKKETVKSKLNKEEPLDCVPDTGYHPISSASICGIVVNNLGTSGVLNAIVYGGRCVNECAYRDIIKNVFDIDLSSCYGSALVEFIYPIGFPRYLRYGAASKGDNGSDNRQTLGQVLKKYESELLDNLFQIIVTGELNFEQDLIFSKEGITEESIIRDITRIRKGDEVIEGDDGHNSDVVQNLEREHIRGTMVLHRKELVNSVITSDILRVAKKVCSPNEWESLMSVQVQTMAYYPKSEMCDTPEQLIEMNKGVKEPSECRGWFPVYLKDFVGNFISTRKGYKALSKPGDYYDLLQSSVKLLVNTVYGCLASPYFQMGNAIIANNITARARVGVWMMAKALGTVQSITDGGCYSNDEVRFIGGSYGRLPAMHTMSDYRRLNAHRSIKIGKLVDDFELTKQRLSARDENGDKTTITKTMEKELDDKAFEHINEFWSHYGLVLPFKIEHKYENTSAFATWDGSADYMLFPQRLIRIRGVRDKEHVKVKKLVAAYNNDWTFIRDEDGNIIQGYSIVKHTIGIKEYQQSPEKFDRLGLRPGDSYEQIQYLRPTRSHFPHNTAEEYHKEQNKERKARERHDKNPSTPFGYTDSKSSSKHVEKGRLNELMEMSQVNQSIVNPATRGK